MIYLYTGTPGSGKSLDVAKKIYDYNLLNKPIICNFPINDNALKKRKNKDSFLYKNNQELSPKFLIEYAKEHCVKGKENQVLLIIDEAQVLFNAREWNVKDRKEWCEFFQLHRHYGYNVILVTQFDRLIDRQIRSLVEYEIIHRKLNNYGIIGAILGLVFMSQLFVRIEYWYGMKEKISSSFFRGNRKLYRLYDSYLSFGDDEESVQEETKKDEVNISNKKDNNRDTKIHNISNLDSSYYYDDDEDLIYINIV